MKLKHIAEILDEKLKTIGVQFDQFVGSKIYTYKTHDQFEIGDICIVSVNRELKLVYVVEVHETAQIEYDSSIDYKWIVQKVDLTKYNNLVERDKNIAKKAAQIMEQKVKRELLEEFKSLLGDDGKSLLEDI